MVKQARKGKQSSAIMSRRKTSQTENSSQSCTGLWVYTVGYNSLLHKHCRFSQQENLIYIFQTNKKVTRSVELTHKKAVL